MCIRDSDNPEASVATNARFLRTASETNETREKTTREREDASDEEVDAGEPYIGAPDIAARPSSLGGDPAPVHVGSGGEIGIPTGLRFSETGSEKAQSSRESRYFHAL